VREQYDLVLCANVLSAIPSPRARSKSLRAICSCLSRDGRVLIVNQHTNSYFTHVRQSPLSTSYGDGWLLRSTKGAAYFGILTKAKVATILKRHGFEVTESWIEGQSNYTLAKRSP
jgi:hypothetical protein